MSYLSFDEIPVPPRFVTKRWRVRSAGGHLGYVGWYAPWRCYAFYSGAATVFEEACLRHIATFCEECTAERKAQREPPVPPAER